MDMVRVTWRDAVTSAGWESLGEAKEVRPHRVTTVGHLLYEDEECLVLGLSVDPQNDDGVSGSVCIPKACVIMMEKLLPAGSKIMVRSTHAVGCTHPKGPCICSDLELDIKPGEIVSGSRPWKAEPPS